MKIPMTLPALGDATEGATAFRWLKSPGEQVSEGEPLVEVSTDEVDSEIDSPATGLLPQILVAEDEAARVSDVIAILAVDDDTTAPPDAKPAEASPGVTTTSSPAAPIVSAPPPGHTSRPATRSQTVVSPGVAPASVGARVQDVSTGGPHGLRGSALRGTTQPVTRIRTTIAHRMVQSLQTSAQLTTIVEVDASNDDLQYARGISAVR